MHIDLAYQALCRRILEEGEQRVERTGVGTISKFGELLEVDLTEGFPLLTTKKVPFKSVLSELLWFLEGSSDERRLAEILHGTRNINNKTIWSPNAKHTSGSKFKPRYNGDLGNIYGVQWRKWPTSEVVSYENATMNEFRKATLTGAEIKYKHIDQVAQIVDKLKNNPTDRRIILSAWNVSELDNMALPPCHMMAQFYVHNNKVLDCQMYQRSVDTFLGLPFNIASYALLTSILAKATGLRPGKLRMNLGDTHIYLNTIDQVKEQLQRDYRPLPQLHIHENMDWQCLKMSDFELEGYNPHPAIKAQMAA